jgi:hypothetical protein
LAFFTRSDEADHVAYRYAQSYQNHDPDSAPDLCGPFEPLTESWDTATGEILISGDEVEVTSHALSPPNAIMDHLSVRILSVLFAPAGTALPLFEPDESYAVHGSDISNDAQIWRELSGVSPSLNPEAGAVTSVRFRMRRGFHYIVRATVEQDCTRCYEALTVEGRPDAIRSALASSSGTLINWNTQPQRAWFWEKNEMTGKSTKMDWATSSTAKLVRALDCCGCHVSSYAVPPSAADMMSDDAATRDASGTCRWKPQANLAWLTNN